MNFAQENYVEAVRMCMEIIRQGEPLLREDPKAV